jgi:hypothetical protein
METALRQSQAANWDIRQGPVEGSRAGTSAWVERFPTWALGLALTAQAEFWDHVASIRDGAKPDEIARRYIRRNQGRRLELISTLLERAAEASDDTAAKIRIWNAGLNAYSVDGVPNTSSPQRALRGPDALKTLGIAAVRVAQGVPVNAVLTTARQRAGRFWRATGFDATSALSARTEYPHHLRSQLARPRSKRNGPYSMGRSLSCFVGPRASGRVESGDEHRWLPTRRCLDAPAGNPDGRRCARQRWNPGRGSRASATASGLSQHLVRPLLRRRRPRQLSIRGALGATDDQRGSQAARVGL